MRPDEEFAPLQIVKKNISDFNRCAYRVYKSPNEFVTVEAATALEAFRESGIKNPLRILRETRFMERLVDQARFTEIEELINTGSVIMEPPLTITGHQEAVPQVQPVAPESMMEEEPEFAAPMEEEAPAEEAAFAEAETVSEEEELSPEDVAKLLGDGE